MKRVSFPWFSVGPLMLLIIPLVAMWYTDAVQWTLGDFLVAGALLLGSGSLFVYLRSKSSDTYHQFGTVVLVLSSLLLIWVNLAVGIIASETHPANQLYAIVVAVAFLGGLLVRFRASAMAKVMQFAAVVQLSIPLVAYLFLAPALNRSEWTVALLTNAMFVAFYWLSGWLYAVSATRKPAGLRFSSSL